MNCSFSYLSPARILLICRPSKHRSDCRHWQIEVKRVVSQWDVTVLQTKALRVVVLREQINPEDADLLRHRACRFREMKKHPFAETLAAAGEINGRTSEMCD